MIVPHSIALVIVTSPLLLVVHWTVTTTTNMYRLSFVEAFVQQSSPPLVAPPLVGGFVASHLQRFGLSTRGHCHPLQLRQRQRQRFAASTDANNDNDCIVIGQKNDSVQTPAVAVSVAAVGDIRADDPYSFVVPILGDLHIDPRKMEDYTMGQEQIVRIIDDAKQTLLLRNDDDGDASGEEENISSVPTSRVALVSLGDLGESKNCDHNPDNPFELFAGTTKCHTMAAEFLNSFGVPYEVIGGNHDLEGIDEFDTDAKNLRRYLRAHNKTTPQFCRQVAEKTLLVGLGSTVFREAKYTSHEVIIDDEQIRWFEELAKSKPAEEGWRIFVFSHAPPNGCGLRIIQENHVVNGCCWLNHSDERKCRKFIEIVRENRCIKVSCYDMHFRPLLLKIFIIT